LKSGWQDDEQAVVHQAASQTLFKSHGNRLSKKKGLMLCQSS
jgi:hypothetical protein